MNFVLDASCALAWVFEDEATSATDKVLDSLGKGAEAVVPALWRWEVANVLLSAERKKRITAAKMGAHLLFFESLPIVVDEAAVDQVWGAGQMLAQKHRLTSYDAAYLEMALRLGLPLASLDRALREAAGVERVKWLVG